MELQEARMQCLKNIHPKFLQPCKSHFSVSQCGQDICIKLSGITQLMARTKYLFYPWSDVDYNISGVDIIVHIKEKPTRATTIGPKSRTFLDFFQASSSFWCDFGCSLSAMANCCYVVSTLPDQGIDDEIKADESDENLLLDAILLVFFNTRSVESEDDDQFELSSDEEEEEADEPEE
ncbi:hypothetical protein OS493_020498 [Desmophyllum pertusum]|uniref:Uncharacterized protein n=1 Tax=Desmophyllum pertusum TaxID=174260 RepID=A0A9X0CSP8_9CNID|nr:hypothetical protein OS493_020498 [Desmophyllum pertusum]